MKPKHWGGILIAGAIVLLLCGGIGFFISQTRVDNTSADTPAAPESAASKGDGGVGTPAKRTWTIKDGTWRVPDEVQPGTYTANVPEDEIACVWQRLRGFSGSTDEMIDAGIGEPKQRMRVTIKKSDRGFSSQGCGTWKKDGA